MIFDWVIGFFVVAIALGLLGVLVGFVRGLLPVRPYPDQRRIAALEYELLGIGEKPKVTRPGPGDVILYRGEPPVVVPTASTVGRVASATFYSQGHGNLSARSTPPTFDG